ncbi:hypothetical protein AWM79_07820 [Pseudomonas agarici]|uniref:TetR family transcriptional regulator n=1 Tax=Pseudomonas agarici TaxID=46677 RepID=A0A0X1SZI1_PSEAA|nr:hypothetical protein [Pseudomonas agarici]AMB85217.1 hypothetical protein AWM79_07820 [Pseudomonas agarici]NWB93092.1 hypothetical protein [Pseudomonas agarici]NWC10145.1 hypothetical protein [Pseudomonas agarici]SEL72669.1 hypothetical protein SAMN05216604_12958 [Pseudomonas agarici]
MNALESEILKNKNDLIEGTFCFELFEEKNFNEILFSKLIIDIEEALKKSAPKPSIELKEFLVWFVMGMMHCIICHNDSNDSYKIQDFSMEKWHETYEIKLNGILMMLIKN